MRNSWFSRDTCRVTDTWTRVLTSFIASTTEHAVMPPHKPFQRSQRVAVMRKHSPRAVPQHTLECRMTVRTQRQNSSDKRMETLQEQSAASHAHFKWTHSTNQRMQSRHGHTKRCLTNSTTTCGAWRTERKLQAIPFSSFPSHCHPIFSCSWSTVYAASVS